MKNSRFFPFERNRYFYGKLLTVRDFENEQKYMNDKRRLVNRLLHGVGVVSGLQVIPVDEKSISVEMGAAIDSLGREIVVSSPVTLKLSTVDGFTNNEYAKNVFLYIAYDEKGKEPVHSVANSSVQNEEVNEYNRVSESYRLFVKEEAPDPSSFQIEQLFQTSSILYDDGQVRIWQSAPRYVNPGETFEVTVHIEKTLQTPQVHLEFDADIGSLNRIDADGDTRVRYVEDDSIQQTEAQFTYFLKPNKTEKASKQTISINNDSVLLKLGDRKIDIGTECSNVVEVIEGPVLDQLIKSYYDQTLDQTVAGSNEKGICLAKISLLQMGPTYIIEKVDTMPYNDFILNPTVLYKLEKASRKSLSRSFLASSSTETLRHDEEPYIDVHFDEERNLFEFTFGMPTPKSFSDEVSTGVVEIDLREGQENSNRSLFGKNWKKCFSEEIEHGLGAGPALIEVAIEETNTDQISEIIHNDEKIYFGDTNVFKDSEYETEGEDISVGVIAYPKRGSFRIGIHAERNTDVTVIKVRWWAFKTKEAK